QPVFIVIATGLLVALAGCAFFYFWRSARARKAHEEVSRRERELRRQFEAVVESTRDGILVLTDTQDIAMISDVAARMLGVRRDEVIGKSLTRLSLRTVDPNLQQVPVLEAFAPTAETPRTVGVPGRRAEDDVRWLTVRSRVDNDAH